MHFQASDGDAAGTYLHHADCSPEYSFLQKLHPGDSASRLWRSVNSRMQQRQYETQAPLRSGCGPK